MGILGQLENPGEDAPGVSGGSGQALEGVRKEFKVKYKSSIVHIVGVYQAPYACEKLGCVDGSLPSRHLPGERKL